MLTPGIILGPYRILEKVGEGGMGEVYKARDTRLDRTVAIKVLSGPPGGMASLRERLQEEARSLSQLNHPNICTLYDIAEAVIDPSSTPFSYLVMEYLEGETLAERLGRGPLAIDRALHYGAQIADALDKAHRAGIIHGDLKPGNVMITRSGVKLLDFGLARRRGTALAPDWADAATRTATIGAPEGLVGTLQYLAPEQLEGRPSDERADIFACGAVIYEMLTGRRAFEGDSPAAVIAAIMGRDPPSVSSVLPSATPAVDHIVSTCLARDPDERWQHAGDLTRELRWLTTAGAVEPTQTPTEATRPIRVWQTLTGLLLLSVLGLLAVWLSSRERVAPLLYRTSVLLPEGLRFPATGTVGGGGRIALSPDGKTLAVVVSDSTGRQMLWVRALEGQTAMPLTGTDGAAAPFWSPDSRSIGFVAQGQLKTIEAGGGEPMVVAPAALTATGAWSRSNEILFTPSASAPLAIIPAAGGTPRSVTRLDEAAGDIVHRNPAFLPDGRRFLYVAASGAGGPTASRRAVYAGSLDTAAPVLVVDNASGARYSDGYLLFLRDATVFAQPFDPARLSLSGEPRPIAEQLETGGVVAASFTVSDAGVLAYQPSLQGGSQLVWVDRQGRQMGSVGDAADYGDIELSPDGRQAAVSVLDISTNTRDLWIVDVTRGVRSRFTFDKSDDIAPIWSRDGTRVIFTSNRAGHFDLYEKAASGIGAETLVYSDVSEKYPTSWLSDAKLLLYWTFSAEGTEVKLLSSETGHPRPFLPSPVSPARFAPDGRHVLYYSSQSGRSEVYLVPFPAATRKWQISNAGGNFARWRPDGKEVFYIGRDNQLVATMVNTDGERVEIGQPTPLFEARPVGARYSYDVAPGGERFLVNTVRGASAVTSVTLVQNWSRLLAP